MSTFLLLQNFPFRADLDKRREEKQQLEERRRRENMENLRKDMEKTGGQTVVLSTGLKDGEDKGKAMMDAEDEEEEEDDDIQIFSEDDDGDIDEDEDEEVAGFSF